MSQTLQNIQTTWDLAGYFYKNLDDPQISLDLKQVETLIQTFKTKYEGRLSTLSEKDFVSLFEEDAELSKLLNRPALYFFYEISLDSQNQKALKKSGELDFQWTNWANQLLFVDEEFKQMGEARLRELANHPDLKDYKNFFIQKADTLQYQLDKTTEEALNHKSIAGLNVLIKLYDEYTNNFSYEMEIDGQTKKFTEEEVRSLRSHSQEEIRKKAYLALHEKYSQKENQVILGNIYSGVVKNWISEMKIRGYPTVLSRRNISEQIPDLAIELLIQEVTKSFPLYQKFLSLKKIALQKLNLLTTGEEEKLKYWNRLQPLSKTNKEIPFEEALKTCLLALGDFDEEIHDYAYSMFLEGRVDVFPKAGKRGGAFASYDKDSPSFVMLNYTSKTRDVSTIAHELGHAIHGHLSQNQKEQVYDVGLCLAETASVFSEMLFSESFVQTLNSPAEKIDFLEARLQDIFATIFQQIVYINFEKEVHVTFFSGKELAYTDLNLLYRKHLQKYLGDSVEYLGNADQDATWSSIPHIFHSPFYCYSYAFGNLLTFGLYQKYKEQGKEFVKNYKNLLKAGGSKPPRELLLENDFDILDPNFYQGGIKVVEKLITDFAKAVENL